MRDAVRRIVDDDVEVEEGEEVFPHDVEIACNGAYDKAALLLLLPTFIVGLYGQNFVDIPELRWHCGYGYVWGVIAVTTFAQLWYFRRKDWL